jgi:hypothetical protein
MWKHINPEKDAHSSVLRKEGIKDGVGWDWVMRIFDASNRTRSQMGRRF